MNINKLSQLQIEIIEQISKAFERLSGERGLFVALHSWGDTMTEEEVLYMLRELNQRMSFK